MHGQNHIKFIFKYVNFFLNVGTTHRKS